MRPQVSIRKQGADTPGETVATTTRGSGACGMSNANSAASHRSSELLKPALSRPSACDGTFGTTGTGTGAGTGTEVRVRVCSDGCASFDVLSNNSNPWS